MAIQEFELRRIMDFLGEKPPFLIQEGRLTTSTDLSGDLASGLKIAGTMSVASLTLNDPAKKQPLVNKLNLDLHEDLSFYLKKEKIVIQKADLSIDRAKINLKGDVSELLNDPSLTLKINSNDIPVKVDLLASEDSKWFLELIDEQIVLEAGETKKADFIITMDRGGRFEGLINVRFSPLHEEDTGTPVGLTAKVIILSDGPIIELPEETEEVVEETEQETPEETEEQVEEEVGEEGVEGTEEQTEEPSTTEPTQQTGPSPVIGIAIIAGILIIGLGAFFGITKFKK